MGTVQKLAEKVKEGLQTVLPKLRKTVINKQSRGFQLEDTQLQAPDRLDRLILIMTLAM